MSVRLFSPKEIAIVGVWLHQDNPRHTNDTINDTVASLAEANIMAYQERYTYSTIESTRKLEGKELTQSYVESYIEESQLAISKIIPLIKKVLPIEIHNFTQTLEYQISDWSGYSNSKAKEICEHVKAASMNEITKNIYKQLEEVQGFTPLRWFDSQFGITDIEKRTLPLPTLNVGAEQKSLSQEDHSKTNPNIHEYQGR